LAFKSTNLGDSYNSHTQTYAKVKPLGSWLEYRSPKARVAVCPSDTYRGQDKNWVHIF